MLALAAATGLQGCCLPWVASGGDSGGFFDVLDDDTGGDNNASGGARHEDTGIAYAYFVGDFEVVRGELTNFNYGWGMYAPNVGEWLCVNEAPFGATGAGAMGCPDCEWSFATRTGRTQQSGDDCQKLLPQRGGNTVMDYDVDDVWFGDARNDPGVGFSEEYIFEGSQQFYQLTSVLFFHYTGRYYDGWYFQAYNMPAYGMYQVDGDESSATIERPWFTTYGQYYLYYYR